jgi:hypothetical protein
MEVKLKCLEMRTHKINIKKFRKKYENLCIYDIETDIKKIEIIEYAP